MRICAPGTTDAQAIQIETANTEVHLTGYVRSLEHKLLAEAAVRDMPGVTKIINELVVSGASPDHQLPLDAVHV